MTDAEVDAIEAGAKKRMRNSPSLRELWALEWILEMAEEIRGRSESLRKSLRVVR